MKKLPIACALDGAGARAQLDDWKALAAYEVSRQDVADGVRVVYRGEAADELERVAAAERACCGFLDITVAAHEGDLVLTVLAPEPELVQDVRALGVA